MLSLCTKSQNAKYESSKTAPFYVAGEEVHDVVPQIVAEEDEKSSRRKSFNT